MTTIENQTFDGERALYGSRDLHILRCRFDGPADGESALKESRGVTADKCYFNLRYPFWHDEGLVIIDSEMTELCRAALWYSHGITINRSRLHGIKALRECGDASIKDSDIISPEFGWNTRGLTMENVTAAGEYFLFQAKDLKLTNVTLKGKYSFQYIENAEVSSCSFDTKDAFWHAKNATIRDSVIKGEYFSWYSDGLTLINCTIIGTQPLCYCKNLKLVGCRMIDTDLSFEKSDVEATLTEPIVSIKNPRSGRIEVPAGEVIRDDPESRAEIIFTK